MYVICYFERVTSLINERLNVRFSFMVYFEDISKSRYGLNFSSSFSDFLIFHKAAKTEKKKGYVERLYIALTFPPFSATFSIFEKEAKIAKKVRL